MFGAYFVGQILGGKHMDTRYCTALLVLALALGACSKPSPSSEPATTASPQALPTTAQPTAAAVLVNKVWVVAESAQVAKGSMRVFLADGTLVMADPGSSPAFGSWRYQDGKFTITEAGQTYATEIVELSPNSLHIRMHSPGQPVDIHFVPASQPTLTPVAVQPVPTGVDHETN